MQRPMGVTDLLFFPDGRERGLGKSLQGFRAWCDATGLITGFSSRSHLQGSKYHKLIIKAYTGMFFLTICVNSLHAALEPLFSEFEGKCRSKWHPKMVDK